MRCMGAKSSEVELEHSFKARRWYHVALTLSAGSALTPGWARLYVDGRLEASERFKYPKVRVKALGRTAGCSQVVPIVMRGSKGRGCVVTHYIPCLIFL